MNMRFAPVSRAEALTWALLQAINAQHKAESDLYIDLARRHSNCLTDDTIERVKAEITEQMTR